MRLSPVGTRDKKLHQAWVEPTHRALGYVLNRFHCAVLVYCWNFTFLPNAAHATLIVSNADMVPPLDDALVHA